MDPFSLSGAAALLVGGLLTGGGFAVASKVVQETEKLGRNIYHEITDEFAQHRKQKDISPLQKNDDINLKLTKGERDLLQELTKSK